MSCCLLTPVKSVATEPPPPTGFCYTDRNASLLNPFSKVSPSHRPIGTGAQYSAQNHAANVDLRKAAVLNLNVLNDFGHRWIDSYASDPLVTVRGYQNNINLPVTLRIPVGFTGGSHLTTYDKGVTIHDHTTGIVHQFFRFYRQTNTTAVADGRYVVDIAGKGYGTPRQSSSASSICQVGLLFRGSELNSNEASFPPIQHALHMAVGARPSDDYMQASKEIVWPAVTRDRYASTSTNNLGHIPYGALFALPRSIDVDGLNLSARGKRFARCLQQYGIYMVDTGKNMTARGDQYMTTTATNDVIAATRVLIPLLRMILNNEQNQTASGGGDPIAPNCAFDATAVWA